MVRRCGFAVDKSSIFGNVKRGGTDDLGVWGESEWGKIHKTIMRKVENRGKVCWLFVVGCFG